MSTSHVARRTSHAARLAVSTIKVMLDLVRRGYTERQIEEIWSGNLPRVMEQVAEMAAQFRQR